MTRMAIRRCLRSCCGVTIPIRVMARITTGSWNSRPMTPMTMTANLL